MKPVAAPAFLITKRGIITTTRNAPIIMSGMLVIAMCFVPSCGDSTSEKNGATLDDVQRQTDEALETAGEFLAEQRDKFINNTQQRLDELDEQVKGLRTKADDLGEDAQAQWRETKQDLESEMDALRAQLNEAKNVTGEAWTEVRTGLEKAAEALEKAYADAVAELDDGDRT